MNNIYKVIWSKAKNCYVVASEIARSHTKSASGSGKIGGVTRRSLLASLMALSLLCGGLGVASAADSVKVDVSTTSTTEVYTTTGVDTLLNDKADKTALDNKADKATTLAGYGITDAYTKGEVYTTGEVDAKLNTKANQTDLTQATDRITANEAAITGLTTKTTEISYAAGDGTKISGVTIKDGNIVGNGNSAITGLTNVATGSINGKSLAGTTVATEKDVSDAVKVETDARTAADTVLEGKINDEKAAREAEDTNLSNRIGTVTEDGTYIKKSATNNVSENLEVLDTQAKTNAEAIAKETADRRAAIGELAVNGNYIEKDKNVSNNLVKLDNQAKANADEIVKTNERTGGIARNLEGTQTTIEGSVKVDKQGNVKEVKGLSAETITTSGNADLKGNVTLGTTAANTVTVNGTADFNEAVNMDKGLTVTNGETNLKKTKVDGDLTVTGTITTDKMIFGDKATNNYTEIDKGHITSKNDVLAGDATKKSSSMELDHSKLEVGVTDKDSNGHLTMTADQTSIKNSDLDGKNYSEIVADKDSVKTTVKDEKDNTTSTKSSATEIRNYAKDKDGNESSIVQTGKDITNTAEKGTITNTAKDIVNNATGDMKNDVGGKLTTTVAGQATENFNGGLNTTVNGAENHTVTGKQINTVGGGQKNIISGGQINNITGDQTTTVTGDISNKAKNITNEASDSITDKVGDHTRVLDGDGITDTVGGSTFKQRIDKIMMESKDVSIKAEETLTNEAKVITNKASEVINNEAVNINNTATGIITSKASEIKNQADKLISNKVGENTWENMENGKITTSIKDGAKQNLTQSDAAGTTQSTVDGGKSTVTIQNADGLADAVTNGTNTSVQNQTASAIAAAVKDGAGNENASVANATISANTIKSGSKANTVISTADGTSFINSEAAAPVTGDSGAGTAVNTTIKGNTITTGKVTMDYADVMKDLGVHGNANITGKTTTGSLEVTGTSTLKGDVTMESNATVKKDLTVEGNTNLKNTKVDGTLDVTQKATFGDSVSIAKDLSVDGNATIKGDVTAKSYKVGDKTYISAAGINANDQKITNVADGSISEGSKDAVNGGQLYGVKRDLEHQVDKVGANAAAMANLRPMEFDPSSKWNIAAAIGNYGSETAAALGAFYRPNDDVMVNLSTAFGTGENMVGGGVSVRLGKSGNKLSREENNALKAQVDDLTARMDALLSVLNPNMSKDFPDVPENHWAYEAVSRLAGNDIVQGYPDGEFHGERTMTRYEMAEIIYNALSRGAEAERELVEEFKPELQAMAASEKATAEKAEG